MTPKALLPAPRAVRVALLTAAALAIICAAAAAQSPLPPGHVALRWNDCYGDGGANIRNFACNTNSGIEDLVASAYPPVAMPQLNGAETRMYFVSIGPTLPNWWQFQSGGCRASTDVVAQYSAPASASSCLDPWLGAATGGIGVTYPFGSPGQARVTVVQAIPGSVAVPASSELFVCRLLIRHTRTVGAGSCTGCLEGACVGLSKVTLYQVGGGAGDFQLLQPLPGTDSDYVGWQAGVAMTWFAHRPLGGGIWEKDFTSCQLATDARRPTWGAIKRMYR